MSLSEASQFEKDRTEVAVLSSDLMDPMQNQNVEHLVQKKQDKSAIRSIKM
jgi:hypothetical protein